MTDPGSLPSYPPPRDEHPLRGRVLDVLVDNGYGPVLDDDGDIKISIDDQDLFIRCADDVGAPEPGQGLAMMRVFGQWRIASDLPADETARLRAANDVTARLTIIKTTVHDDLLLASAEFVVADGLDLHKVLAGTFEAILAGVRMWHEGASGAGTDPAGD